MHEKIPGTEEVGLDQKTLKEYNLVEMCTFSTEVGGRGVDKVNGIKFSQSLLRKFLHYNSEPSRI